MLNGHVLISWSFCRYSQVPCASPIKAQDTWEYKQKVFKQLHILTLCAIQLVLLWMRYGKYKHLTRKTNEKEIRISRLMQYSLRRWRVTTTVAKKQVFCSVYRDQQRCAQYSNLFSLLGNLRMPALYSAWEWFRRASENTERKKWTDLWTIASSRFCFSIAKWWQSRLNENHRYHALHLERRKSARCRTMAHGAIVD